MKWRCLPYPPVEFRVLNSEKAVSIMFCLVLTSLITAYIAFVNGKGGYSIPYYLTTDNTALYYEAKGKGQPVVFLHGWSGSHEHMAEVSNNMSDNYLSVVYSHRGHGASDISEEGYTIPNLAQDLKNLIDYLGLEDVVLVGHSMGGYVVYEYVRQFGCDKIKKIIIIDMSPKITCDSTWRFGAFGCYDEKSLLRDIALMSFDFSKFLEEFFRKILPGFSDGNEDIVYIVAPDLENGVRTRPLISLWQSMFTLDYRDVIALITVPIAYIHPQNSIYPTGAAKFVSDYASAPVRIIEYPGCTHMSPVEKPIETARDIMAFIEEKQHF